MLRASHALGSYTAKARSTGSLLINTNIFTILVKMMDYKPFHKIDK